MAKTIIIIEDEDTATSRISVQVMRLARPSETDDNTPAKVLGGVIEAALQDFLAGRSFDAHVMPMASAARH